MLELMHIAAVTTVSDVDGHGKWCKVQHEQTHNKDLSSSRHTIKRHTNDYTRQYACFFAVIMVIRLVISTSTYITMQSTI